MIEAGHEVQNVSGARFRLFSRRQMATLRQDDELCLGNAVLIGESVGRGHKAVLIAPQVPFYNMRGIKLLGGRGWNNQNLIKYGEKYVEGAYFVDGFFALRCGLAALRQSAPRRTRWASTWQSVPSHTARLAQAALPRYTRAPCRTR